MNYMKRRKIKKFFQKHKKIIIGTGSFALVGLIGGILGFEIANDWHAIRNWINSPWASTFFILMGLGIIILILLLITFIYWKGDNE